MAVVDFHAEIIGLRGRQRRGGVAQCELASGIGFKPGMPLVASRCRGARARRDRQGGGVCRFQGCTARPWLGSRWVGCVSRQTDGAESERCRELKCQFEVFPGYGGLLSVVKRVVNRAATVQSFIGDQEN